jgi:endo-1,4-beta-xylanase
LQIGCAVGRDCDESERALLVHHFNQVTPENCMKPEPIHPSPSRFQFDAADALLTLAESHGLEVVGHTLCRHQQSPAWFFQPDADARTPEQRLGHHIHEVAGRAALGLEPV